MPPGVSAEDLAAKPFHIYNDEFLSVIGSNPTLTLIAEQATDPLYHEAVVWLVLLLIKSCRRSIAVQCKKSDSRIGTSRPMKYSSFRMQARQRLERG